MSQSGIYDAAGLVLMLAVIAGLLVFLGYSWYDFLRNK